MTHADFAAKFSDSFDFRPMLGTSGAADMATQQSWSGIVKNWTTAIVTEPRQLAEIEASAVDVMDHGLL